MSLKELLKEQITGLQHVGHIVASLDDAIASFERIYGVSDQDIRRLPKDPEAPTLFAFVTVADAEFELIQPQSEQARAELFASASGGGGINHVAWRVRDLGACVSLLAARGIHPGHVTPDGIVEFGNRKMVYLDPVDCDGLLVELIEIND